MQVLKLITGYIWIYVVCHGINLINQLAIPFVPCDSTGTKLLFSPKYFSEHGF